VPLRFLAIETLRILIDDEELEVFGPSGGGEGRTLNRLPLCDVVVIRGGDMGDEGNLSESALATGEGGVAITEGCRGTSGMELLDD